jgi:hypothetical protein
MSKRKSTKAWVAYKIVKIGRRLGTVYGETEKEALASAQKRRRRSSSVRHSVSAIFSKPARV